MGIDQERHRPGLLKQQNKAHKSGRHRSKGAIQVSQKGRTPVKTLTKRFKKLSSKIERRNQILQNRLRKRQETLQNKRMLGSNKTAPFLIAVVPLHFDIDSERLFKFVQNCCEDIEMAVSPEKIFHINIGRLKQKFSFITPQKGNTYAIIDSLKIADTVLFIVSAATNSVVDKESENILMSILAQGLPSVVVAAFDLENMPLKKRSICRQELQKVISQWLPKEKIFSLDKDLDALNLLRKIGSQKKKPILFRDKRPHLLAEHLDFVREPDSDFGVLKVSGYLRGQILSVNSLVHITGWGDFQMKQIDGFNYEYSDNNFIFNSSKNSELSVLEVADPTKQLSLVSENIPNPMDSEQTWPTEEEMESAEEVKHKLFKKIPKGMSDYQACWIPEEGFKEVDDKSDDDDFNEEYTVGKAMSVDSDDDYKTKVTFDDENLEKIISEDDDIDIDNYDKTIDLSEENLAQEQLKQAKLDEIFPDEIDTPLDIPARIRFQKYRGLSSFRTSPWDPKENLPYDYARIFQFENFNKTRKRIFMEVEYDKIGRVQPGSYITIYIDKVHIDLYNSHQIHQPLVVYGMLEHEQKMSVINFVLKRCQSTPWSSIPIKSKEELIFQCGYRRYKGKPIFSQHTNGTKHKYERYFQPGSMVVATLFAPIMFPPASVLVFKQNPDNTQDLIATGNVLSVNPDRLVIKRVVLSGHPFKIHKKSAVVRFMFFNREDINWFKPVELKTKYGRRGHIREPLGTHGHMKVVFDGQLKSQDTVLMFLYKRVFPKWCYDIGIQYTNSRYKKLCSYKEEKAEKME